MDDRGDLSEAVVATVQLAPTVVALVDRRPPYPIGVGRLMLVKAQAAQL